MADGEPTLAEQAGRRMGEDIAAGLDVMARTIRSLHPDPWDSCLDVDPFTGQPDHQHGDACPDCCQS